MAFDTASLLGGAIGKIIVRTNLAPPIVLENPFGTGAGGAPGGLLAVIRPKIELYDPSGALIYATAPAGEPSDLPLIPLLAVLAGVVVIVVVAATSR